MGLRRTLGSMRPLQPRINLKRTQRPRPDSSGGALCPAGSVPHPAVQSSVAEPQRRCLSGLRKPIDKSLNGHFPCPMSHFRRHDSMAHGKHAAQPVPGGSSWLWDVHVGVFAARNLHVAINGTRPPICILSLAILIPLRTMYYVTCSINYCSGQEQAPEVRCKRGQGPEACQAATSIFQNARSSHPIPSQSRPHEAKQCPKSEPCGDCSRVDCCTTPLASVGGASRNALT